MLYTHSHRQQITLHIAILLAKFYMTDGVPIEISLPYLKKRFPNIYTLLL